MNNLKKSLLNYIKNSLYCKEALTLIKTDNHYEYYENFDVMSEIPESSSIWDEFLEDLTHDLEKPHWDYTYRYTIDTQTDQLFHQLFQTQPNTHEILELYNSFFKNETYGLWKFVTYLSKNYGADMSQLAVALFSQGSHYRAETSSCLTDSIKSLVAMKIAKIDIKEAVYAHLHNSLHMNELLTINCLENYVIFDVARDYISSSNEKLEFCQKYLRMGFKSLVDDFQKSPVLVTEIITLNSNNITFKYNFKNKAILEKALDTLVDEFNQNAQQFNASYFISKKCFEPDHQILVHSKSGANLELIKKVLVSMFNHHNVENLPVKDIEYKTPNFSGFKIKDILLKCKLELELPEKIENPLSVRRIKI